MWTQHSDAERVLHMVGFWSDPSSEQSGPDPTKLVKPEWGRDVRDRLIRYLRDGSVLSVYRGFSFCRFNCGIAREEMGHATLTDGVWVWPAGLAHYVEAHAICLPDAFLEHARHNEFRVPADVGGAATADPVKISADLWESWTRALGAVAT